MTLIQKSITASFVFALAGCELSQEEATNSGFLTPNASGVITGGVDNDGQQVRRTVADSTGNGFAFAGGTNEDGLAAYSGVIPDSTGGAVVTEGSATYATDYTLYRVTDIVLDESGFGEGFISGTPAVVTGNITLTADFDGATLTGTSEFLTVNGQINGSNLSGGVTYRDVDGELDGVIGADRTVGAFHGNDKDLIYAGGFIGTAQPPEEPAE